MKLSEQLKTAADAIAKLENDPELQEAMLSFELQFNAAVKMLIFIVAGKTAALMKKPEPEQQFWNN